MLAPCVCVRESAPERGDARDVVYCFLASFGLGKFGLLRRSKRFAGKVPSACAAIYAR